VIAAVASSLAGGVALFLNENGVSGVGSSTMTTGGTSGCRNGLLERPQTDALKVINILHFDGIRVLFETPEADSVDEVVVRANGTTVHTERIFGSGRHNVSFDGGEATMFELEARAGGDVVDRMRFYARCGDSNPDT
jgi:hypothetical protein